MYRYFLSLSCLISFIAHRIYRRCSSTRPPPDQTTDDYLYRHALELPPRDDWLPVVLLLLPRLLRAADSQSFAKLVYYKTTTTISQDSQLICRQAANQPTRCLWRVYGVLGLPPPLALLFYADGYHIVDERLFYIQPGTRYMMRNSLRESVNLGHRQLL